MLQNSFANRIPGLGTSPELQIEQDLSPSHGVVADGHAESLDLLRLSHINNDFAVHTGCFPGGSLSLGLDANAGCWGDKGLDPPGLASILGLLSIFVLSDPVPTG